MRVFIWFRYFECLNWRNWHGLYSKGKVLEIKMCWIACGTDSDAAKSWGEYRKVYTLNEKLILKFTFIFFSMVHFRYITNVIYVKWFYFVLKWSEVKWVTLKFLRTKVPCTLAWPYIEDTWLYCDYFIGCVYCTVVILTCFVICGCLYVWVW